MTTAEARATDSLSPSALGTRHHSPEHASIANSIDPASGAPMAAAQVTPLPLPHVDDFHVGRVLGDNGAIGTIATAAHEADESYIPVALARAHLARVVQDMHAMKATHATKVNQIVDRCKTIEAETKSYYEAYITELKRTAKDKFRVEQTRYAALETQQRETQQLMAEEIRGVHLSHDRRHHQHKQQQRRWREAVETSFVQYEEELTRLHGRVKGEIASALQQQALSLNESHTVELTQLQQAWDDTRAECERVTEQAKQTLQHQLIATQTTYETQIQQLRRDAAVEMETFQCVAAVVNRIVDMDSQMRRRKRSRELQGEIISLTKQVDASTAKEQSLATRLSHMIAQCDAMEQRAVRQTMDVLLRTVELTPVAVTVDPPIDRALVDAVNVMPSRPLVVESEAQTTDWTTLLAANLPASPLKPVMEMRDAAMETDTEAKLPEESMRPEELPSLGLTHLATATQLQYEADAERFRARNAELIHSKHVLRDQKTEMQACCDRKNDAKARIKQWLADFQKTHARDPTIEEKAQVKDLYLAFKASEEAYNAAKERVALAKTQHHERVVEVEALSQWHALAATTTARGSSRGHSSESSTRPSTATTIQEDSTATATALHEVETLAQEIETLRAELKAAQAEKKQADDDAQRAEQEAKQAKADAKETADRWAALGEAKALEAASRATVQSVAVFPVTAAKADATANEVAHRAAQDQRNAEFVKQHQERIEAAAREAETMERERIELQVSITRLREEISARVTEKQALETQIEQLRLHVELMDSHDDDLLLESDAKASSSRHQPHDGDEEIVAGDDDEEEEEEMEKDEEAVNDATASAQSPLKTTITEAERSDGVKDQQLIVQIKEAIEAGKTQWNRGDKAKCFQIYVKMSETCIDTLRAMTALPGRRDDVAALRGALQEAGRLPPAKGSMVLRRQLDSCLAACEARTRDRAAAAVAAEVDLAAAAAKSPSARTTPSSSPQRKTQHKKSLALSSGIDSPLRDDKTTTAPSTAAAATTPVAGKAIEEYKQKLKALETKAKADKVRITQLEAALAKAEMQLTTATSAGGAGSGAAASTTVLLERKLADAEKKHAKALDEAERALKKEVAAVTQQLSASQATSQTLQSQVDTLTKELAVVGGRATQLVKMEEEVTVLRAKAAQADTLSQELTASKSELTKLEASYKEEQALRKKYYNLIEDMKGKIRVYARCRPMSSSENERGCGTCVRFVDEFSLELKTSHGPKAFAYDQVFTPASTQDQVFEDTKNLLQSAMDGYNVCIFAYGQTGSGKTFTMTGSDALPGLSPRAIHHLFRLADECKANHTITFQAFMLELYNDTLIDLFHLVDGGSSGHDAPKLDIKKNDRGMVYVSNSTSKSCTSAQQTLKLFDAANKKRQVGATKMNAESSRSHSVFSIVIENYNKTTKTTSIGKLSLVDLAGSERAGKTGATNDRLKEAQAINKSLSALGDVIAALSAGEKFIPYRNNKLTQLMQDSLGGNAKTLMFVNISPADYNQEETQTSLQYASRVKLITNSANKTSESETVNRLKHIIKQLRAGKSDVEFDGLGLE